jgi:hypothetical protein
MIPIQGHDSIRVIHPINHAAEIPIAIAHLNPVRVLAKAIHPMIVRSENEATQIATKGLSVSTRVTPPINHFVVSRKTENLLLESVHQIAKILDPIVQRAEVTISPHLKDANHAGISQGSRLRVV